MEQLGVQGRNGAHCAPEIGGVQCENGFWHVVAKQTRRALCEGPFQGLVWFPVAGDGVKILCLPIMGT